MLSLLDRHLSRSIPQNGSAVVKTNPIPSALYFRGAKHAWRKLARVSGLSHEAALPLHGEVGIFSLRPFTSARRHSTHCLYWVSSPGTRITPQPLLHGWVPMKEPGWLPKHIELKMLYNICEFVVEKN